MTKPALWALGASKHVGVRAALYKLVLALLAMIQNAGQECPTVIVGLDNCNDVLVSVIRMALRQLMQVRALRAKEE